MNYTSRIKLLLCCAAVALIANGYPALADAAAAGEKPNIVLLISDDDDYEHFGFMGSKIAHTPTLDHLAESGTLFTMAHVPAPLCRPSLASLLSGRMPHQHGIYGNYLERTGIGNDSTKLDPTGSLANRLKAAGYATYATAKYWEGDPRAMGFTHGTIDVTRKGFDSLVRKGQDELFEFIDGQRGKNPMFIWWAPIVPHGPHNPPEVHAERFADTPIPIPDFYKGDKKRYVEELRKFYAMGTWFDAGVARLIEKLKEAGEFENTVFLFYIDNGYTYGQPAKNSPTEKGLRTPLFVSWPGHVPAGKRIDGLNYALDLHATILDYAGLKPPADIASRTLRPRIEGKTDQDHDALYGAVYAHAPANYKGDSSIARSPQRDVYALYVRTERWKYVLYTQDLTAENDRYIWMVHQLSDAFKRRQGEQNLFDMRADPYEANNLAEAPEHKQRLAEFREQALGWWKSTGGQTLAVASAAAAAAEPDAAQASGRPPNVVVIFADDMGYADIGPFGAEGYATPNLDRMAREGMKFTDFHVGRSVCSPSRAALMTGCYPLRVGVPGNFGPSSKTGLNPDETTIAEIVKQKGYATAMYGKWHLGHKPEFLPISQGFDEWFGLPYSHDMWPYHPDPRYNFPDLPLMEGAEVLNPAVKPADQRNLTTWYTERAVKFIEANREQPFLIYLPHAMPHVPLYVSDKYKDTAERGLYGDVVSEIDWCVGQILDALKRNDIDEETLVIFTSDNGPWLLYGDHGGSAGPLREGKGTSFEGGFRVPCVMRWPGKIPAGETCDELASTMDVLPTLAALIGAKLPADRIIDGKDIRSLMFGESGAKTPHESFYYYAGANLQAVRSGKWKLMFPHQYSVPERRGSGGQHGERGQKSIGLSLFNLDADVGEKNNVAGEHPRIVARLQALAETAREDIGDGKRTGRNRRPVGTLAAGRSGNARTAQTTSGAVTIDSLLREMIDRDAVARFPASNFRLRQASSYNRASKTPDDPEGWFANRDNTDYFVRTETNQGRKEWVIMEHKAPGAIVRSWMPDRREHVVRPAPVDTYMRIYLDGADEPAIEGHMLDLFNGTGLIPAPFGHKSLASAVSFFPIPYAKSCKVTLDAPPFYYIFTHREYPAGTRVRTFTMEDFEASRLLIKSVGEALSNPASAGGGKRVSMDTRIDPGAEASVDLPAGTAAVRALSLKLGSYDDPQVMRSVVLKIAFDGKDTVWCPVGEFFGSGAGLNPFQGWWRTVDRDGTMSCRWVMPYRESGKITLVNLHDEPVDAKLEAAAGEWTWDERSMYFHANWRHKFPMSTRPYFDFNYVTLTGRGVYVGDTLTVMNTVKNWWGEGDAKIWVDGESFPSIFGTGTEDYYAYSWGGQHTIFYEHPFHAQPFAHRYNKLNPKIDLAERDTSGYNTETRTRALDTMPFGDSLQVDMEVLHQAECEVGYAVGTYWYGFADTESNRQPDPDEAKRALPQPPEAAATVAR